MSTTQLIRAISASQNRRNKQRLHASLINGSYDPNYINEWEEFEELSFDKSESRLTFIIRKYTEKPKITRYVTNNYVKTPIYGELKTSSKIVKKFNKVINKEKFLNEDVLELDIDPDLLDDMIIEIGLMPHWRDKLYRIEDLNKSIDEARKNYRSFEVEKKKYDVKKVNYVEKQGNFWLRLVFSLITLGLSFVGYVSKKQVQENILLNEKNKIYNEKNKKEVDEFNDTLKFEIQVNNDIWDRTIQKAQNDITDIELEEWERIPEEDGWIMIKEASTYGFEDLKDLKGIYIIKNMNKNIYYVGQSKDLRKRLNQHFKNGTVNNVKFAKDWYDGDIFGFKYKTLDTKDELDSEEKRLIEYYDSFNNGYNSTGGNY